jgi:uncharacterized membrane protein
MEKQCIFENVRAGSPQTVRQIRRNVMKHSIKKRLAVVAFGTIIATSAVAQPAPKARHDARGSQQQRSVGMPGPGKAIVDDACGLPSSGCWNELRNVN